MSSHKKTPFQEREESFVLMSDIIGCLKRHSGKIFIITFLFAALGLILRLMRPVKYEVQASFKEASSGTQSGEGVLETLLKYSGITNSQQSYKLIKSRLLMNEVIEKLALQATVEDQSLKETIYQNWKAASGRWVSPLGAFRFESVGYRGEKTKNFDLIFSSQTQFEIRNKKKKIVAHGVLGKPIHFENVTMTLAGVPKKLKLSHPYGMRIEGHLSVFKKLSKEIEVVPCPSDTSLYEFWVAYPERLLGIKVLDTLMDEYRDYLCRETDRIAHEQLTYLERRKDELRLKMDQDLAQHATYLNENLGIQGFLNTNEHLQLVNGRREHFLNKLTTLDFQTERLEGNVAIEGELVFLQKQMQELQKQRDSLDLAYLDSPAQKKASINEKMLMTGQTFFFPAQKQSHETSTLPSYPELEKVREKKAEAEMRLSNVEGKDESAIAKHELHLLSLEETLLQERLYANAPPSDLQGMDLESARILYREYIQKRDDLESKIKQLNFSKTHLDEPDFEYISLVQILPDEVGKQLARKLGELKQLLSDTRHLTEREISRAEKKVNKLARNLLRHIDQTIDLTFLQVELLSEKLMHLKDLTLELLSHEIALTRQQIDDRVAEEQKALQVERHLVENRLNEIEEELSPIPDLWLKENQLKFNSEISQSMLQGIAELVESKNAQRKLMHVQSKPIDQAYASITPRAPYLTAFGTLGGFIGFLIICSVVIIYELRRGFPLSLKNLKMQGKVVCGVFSGSLKTLEKVRNGDLKTLRALSSLLVASDHPKVMTLMTSGRGSYASPFAELLVKEGKRVLLVDLDRSSKPGLAAYLSKEVKKAEIEAGKVYDSLSMGSKSRFAIEWLKHPRFEAFLSQVKKDYDVILLATTLSPDCAEGRFFMNFSDLLVLTLNHHSNDDLMAYYDWEESAGLTKLAFVSN